MHPLVANRQEALETIARFQGEAAAMAERLSMATAWCASRDERGRWIFGPSKFVGYRGLTARSYLASAQERDGGATEQRLQHWFAVVPEDHPLHAELQAALTAFLARFGKLPRKKVRINL